MCRALGGRGRAYVGTCGGAWSGCLNLRKRFGSRGGGRGEEEEDEGDCKPCNLEKGFGGGGARNCVRDVVRERDRDRDGADKGQP